MPHQQLSALLSRAQFLATRVANDLVIRQRLKASVIRPLHEALGQVRQTTASELSTDAAVDESAATLTAERLADELWTLAQEATTLHLDVSMPLQVGEAAAALLGLACELTGVADANRVPARLADGLRRKQIQGCRQARHLAHSVVRSNAPLSAVLMFSIYTNGRVKRSQSASRALGPSVRSAI